MRYGCLLICIILLSACSTTKTGLTNKQQKREAAEQYANLGAAYLRNGNIRFALQRLQRALELDPNHANAHHFLAQAYVGIDRHDEAQTHFAKALELADNDTFLHNNYGAYLCGRGRFDLGEQLLLKATKDLSYEAPESVFENLGLCLQGKGDDAKAEQYFRQALKLQPRMAKTYYQLAALKFRQGQYFAARSFIQNYEKLARHGSESLRLAIKVEEALGDRNAVNRYRQELEELLAKHPRSQSVETP